MSAANMFCACSLHGYSSTAQEISQADGTNPWKHTQNYPCGNSFYNRCPLIPGEAACLLCRLVPKFLWVHTTQVASKLLPVALCMAQLPELSVWHDINDAVLSAVQLVCTPEAPSRLLWGAQLCSEEFFCRSLWIGPCKTNCKAPCRT